MSKKERIGKKVKRELTRAMLERTQSMDMMKMMSMFGATEPVMYDDVVETLNVAYINRDEVALAMDIFSPKDSEGKELPVIVILHGGGLFMGDRGLERPYSRLLAHKGYLVFSLEYRLAPRANICEQLDDVCSGMDHVGRMLVNYDVDFSRMFMVADSAGAYLACYVTAMHNSEKLCNAIGYKPSRMVYSAVGFLSGMFYTNKTLQDQIYGDKRGDEDFKKFMSIEHPEIVNNLPPAFMLTSCGDTFNNYSLKFNKVLKAAGRPSKLVFFGNEELQHVFPITNPEHPKSIEGTDKMLAFFEEQADIKRESRKPNPEVKKNKKQLEQRIEDGSLSNQKVWSNLKERITVDPANLKKTAIIDCTREYTYEQMFEEWDRYAKVFSGLGICSANKSRVALCGAITAEPLFALYALNMTGAEVSLFSYPDFLPGGMWKEMIEKEKITDLIITDIMVTSEVWDEIQAAKKKYNINNVILIHSLMGGPSIGPAELIYNEYNYHRLYRRTDTVFMSDLFEKYKDEEIKLDRSKGKRIAFITHTSGTTNGTRKMLPFTDKVFNDTVNLIPNGYRSFVEGNNNGKQLRNLLAYDMSSIMSLSGQTHTLLSSADTIVMTYFGFMHPKFIRAIDYYNISTVTITGFMVDKWLSRPDLDTIDLSSLKVIGISGGYVSPEKMDAYKEFFRSHGYKYEITAGYGMSETGGKPIFAPKDSNKDILGFEDTPGRIRIKDENDGKFYSVDDGPRTGVLYLSSDTHPDNKLDGNVIFELTKIDGINYICTNDLVQINEDTSISYAGRTDKFFINNNGKQFDAGIVDINMSKHPSIDNCAVVPILDKRIQDTVPVLYVVPSDKTSGAPESIRKAFVDIYINDKKCPLTSLPSQFVIVKDIPLNTNGKLDIYRITRERIDGVAYNIEAIYENNVAVDIRIKHVYGINSMTAGTLPRGMSNNSAYNAFDMFNSATASGETFDFSSFNPLKPLKMFMPDMEEIKKNIKGNIRMPQVPDSVKKSVLKYGNRVSGLSNGRKQIDFDFED